MKKIGIITHYGVNRNYGGLLQAYALQKVIAQQGNDAVHIAYDMNLYPKASFFKRLTIMLFNPKRLYEYVFCKDSKKEIPEEIIEKLSQRNKLCIEFREEIPHTRRLYNFKNIDQCEEVFDTYVTGSDQVWNLRWYHPAYFLHFVPDGKKKISYAASISCTSLSEEQTNIFKEHLKDYSAVSVREQDAIDLIENLSPVKTSCVLDPTLLLSRNEWDKISDTRLVEESYIFCYFLAIDEKKCKIAREYADLHGLKIVTIPYLEGYSKNEPNDFGDYRLYNIGPKQFISLIKYSEYVLTDSFHACVFSGIYQKKYYVFNRKNTGEMNSRIYNLLGLFSDESCFCDTEEKMNVNYMNSVCWEKNPLLNENFLLKKEESIRFLEDNL